MNLVQGKLFPDFEEPTKNYVEDKPIKHFDNKVRLGDTFRLSLTDEILMSDEDVSAILNPENIRHSSNIKEFTSSIYESTDLLYFRKRSVIIAQRLKDGIKEDPTRLKVLTKLAELKAETKELETLLETLEGQDDESV